MIAAFCACVIVLANFAGVFVVSAEDDTPLEQQPAATIAISSSADLIAYSREYARGGHNPDDTIQLAMSAGTVFVLPSGDSGYVSIGTSSRPFNGTVEIADNATAGFISDVPLFGYITTAASTVNTAGATRELQIARLASSDNALFAQHVVNAAGSAADWKIILKPDDRDSVNATAESFAGVVGDVAADCKVRIDFTHDSVSASGTPANAVSAGDVGTICCTLGEGAELTFKVASANEYTVNSANGYAGGVVGSAANGAKLIAEESFTSVANVTSGRKYAGALVGAALNAEIELVGGATVTLSKTVTGSEGAGGVYGYYKSTAGNGSGANADVRTFELDGIITDSGFTIAGTGNVGALSGTLDSDTSVTITETSAVLTDNAFTKQVRFTGGGTRGGLIGRYSNTLLTNTLDVHNVEVKILANSGSSTISGGLIGTFGMYPLYASISDARVTTNAAVSGGIVGSAGEVGSFLDVSGTIDVDGSVGSGLVSALNEGVLRIAGTTDLSGASYSSAQLVNTRGNGLVYALGSGSDAGWTFKRGSGTVDDIGDWGEALRLSSANGLAESDFFTVDMNAHTVTVAGHAASMASKKDFIKTALNVQHNYADKGALKFSSGSRSGSILGGNLSLTADIDLSGTGIVALTRDNGSNAAFTGSFNGNGRTVYLAVGEPYGMSGGAALSAPANIGANNYGTVIGHQYLGLFAKVSNAVVSDLTVDGYISLFAAKASSTYNVGGVAAQVSGSSNPVTLTNVDTKQDIHLFGQTANSSKLYCGGAIGLFDTGAAGTAVISGSVFENDIIENNRNGAVSSNVDAYVGGAIGHVASVSALTFDFDNVTVAGKFDNCVNGSCGFRCTRYGGLIGTIAANSGNFTRSVLLNNVTVSDAASISTRVRDSAACAGGLLGCEWIDANVTIGTDGGTDGVIIGSGSSGPSVTWKKDGSIVPAGGALVGRATGHWTVNHVDVNALTLNAVDPCTFGFIVNDGTNGTSSAIYLDLVSDGYDVANTAFSGTFNSFDEVVRNTVVGDNRIDGNGNGVVSIRTAGGAPLVTDGAGCNTYQNQTAYGKNTRKVNDKTRYYYNLDLIRNKSSKSDAEKLLLWSLNRYAHSSINKSANGGFFNNAYNNRISGNCDMAGLSYYPVDVSGVTIQNATVKFYNQEIEDGEGGSGDSDGHARSTRADVEKTQHYLMHQGLFLNCSNAFDDASLTVNVLTLEGNVSLDEGDSGFLVRRTLGDTTKTLRANLKNITLAGAEISNRTSGAYSPLLINNVGKNVKLDITGLATGGSGADVYPSTGTAAVASSLIGNVGYDTATNINLTFSDIKLDARTATGGMSGLNTAYGTDRSIFDRATFLESFRFLNGSLGEYNYTYDEDWTSNRRRVTYGKEVKDSVEYAGLEDHYYNDPNRYTHPTDSSGASAYNFSSGFLPYVNHAYDAANGYHEIKVNVKNESLTTGCGQYNDPYIITNGAMLATAAKIISGSPIDGVNIALPTNVGSNTLDMWCDNKNTHATYTYSGGSFVNDSDAGDTKSLANVRAYLAGAYYSIASEIELPADFVGFGGGLADWTATSGFNCQYAFRGVIVGGTIINKSNNPLIKSANGCVVKNVTVRTDSAIGISQNSVLPFRYDNAACASYGAVIGQVMGGDNVIDNVRVYFTVEHEGEADTQASFPVANSNPDCNRLMPVGGYIGVVLNGGVIFRNMAAASGLTSDVCPQVADDGWLYVNPIIGRVIAGYAFNEASSYAANSATVNNGTKNYGIPDLVPSSSAKLEVNATGRDAYTVNIPDAQAFYILSCVVNSGAGSASYGSSNTDYASITDAQWIGYREYTSTRCAAYSDVGTGAASSGDYDIVAAQDIYAGRNKTPYIIRQYTASSSATLLRARSVCGNSSNKSVVSAINLTGDSYDMPAGFRGIGSIYSNDKALYLQFKQFNGNGKTVNLNMKYQEYNHESGISTDGNGIKTISDKKNIKTNLQIENYKPYAGAGFGMINAAYLDSFNAGSDTNSIKNLTLTGSVFYDIRKLSNGGNIKYGYGWHNYNNQTAYYPDAADRIEAADIMHTGGVTGTSVNSIYYSNVALDGLTVEGPKYTGGYIGYLLSKNLVADAPSATGLTVKGGFAAGGLVGGFGGNQANGSTAASADLTIKGSSSATAVIGLTDVQVKGEPSTAKIDFADFEQMHHCGGGLVGYACTGTGKTATVQYVTVSGGSLTATKRMRRPSDMRYKILLGGFFGRLENSKVDFSNSSVEGLEISGSTCGGLIGVTRNSVQGTITDVTIDGNNKTIDATNMVGGLIGYVFGGDMRLKLTSVNVENYSIVSSYNSEKASAGGLIGTFTVNNNANSYFNLTDSKIVDCTVSRCATYTADNSPALIGVGGMFGALNGNANGKVCGHNILLDGVSVVNNGGNKTPGMLIGTNTKQTVKFAGVSIQGGTSATINVVGINNSGSGIGIFGTNGYVVMADFDGDCIPASRNESDSSRYNASTDYAATYPFVTVNPMHNVGGANLALTGDGVSDTVAGLPIQEIIAGDRRYKYASDLYKTQFNTAKLSTYNAEQNASLADDFAVLIIDDISRINTTNTVNSYINMLANTNYNYAVNNNSIYKINLYKMVYDEGAGGFVPSGAANLQRNTGTGQFAMDINNVDTAGHMFTLIDVGFCDPADTSKIAYHLYIPALVKKMLTFDFDIATGTGTNYERAWYTVNDRFGKPLMENLGTPASIFFKYNYIRSYDEWTAAANNGDNMLWNYPKTLTLTKSSSIPDLPGDTILVLNDATNGGKPYYARFREVYNAGTGILSLANFRETLDDNTSAAFTPCDFNDFPGLSFTAADDPNGTLILCDSAPNLATVRATYNGAEHLFRVANEADAADHDAQHVTLSADLPQGASSEDQVDMSEPYYVSFFTDSTSSNVVYHYTISAPATFGVASSPSRIADAAKLQGDGGGNVHLILGNIFVQSGVSLTTSPNFTEMSVLNGNRRLTAEMETTVSLDSALKSEVQAYLGGNSNINVFHSFMLYLTRNENDGSSRRIITGNPNTSGTYVIGSVNGAVASTANEFTVNEVNNATYAEIRSANVNRHINEYLVAGNGAVINASVTFEWDNDVAISEQFPNREDETNVSIGTTASCTSNVAFYREGTSYSKIAAGANDSANHSYYCKIDNRTARLHYNVRSDVFVGDYGPLGINPLDDNALTEVQISTLGVYDISDIEEKAENYDMIRCTLRLYSKEDGYTAGRSFRTYMSSVAAKGYDAGVADYSENKTNEYEYTFVLPRGVVTGSSALPTSLELPFDFKIYTGAAFEAAGLTYSNYKIRLNVELFKKSDPSDVLLVSQAENYLIYTNARVIPDYVD